MQGLRTARARELFQACRLQGTQGPAHAPAAAAAPPAVSGADERRGEKYTRGSSAAAAAGWPASHCSAVAPRGSGTCAPRRSRRARPQLCSITQRRLPGRCRMRSHNYIAAAPRSQLRGAPQAIRAGRAAEQTVSRGSGPAVTGMRRRAAGQAAKQAPHLDAQQPARAVRVAALRAPHSLAQPLQRLAPVQLRPTPLAQRAGVGGRAGREPADGSRSLALAAGPSAASCWLGPALPYPTQASGQPERTHGRSAAPPAAACRPGRPRPACDTRSGLLGSPAPAPRQAPPRPPRPRRLHGSARSSLWRPRDRRPELAHSNPGSQAAAQVAPDSVRSCTCEKHPRVNRLSVALGGKRCQVPFELQSEPAARM